MLPPVFTWIPLPHLPHPPEHFIQRAFDRAESNPEEDLLLKPGVVRYPGHAEYKHRQLIYKGKEYRSRCQESIPMGQDWEDWVASNITSEYLETTVRLNVAIDDSTVHGAHVDGRFLRLYYLLDRGGEDATTEFYYKPNNPIIYNVPDNERVYFKELDDLVVIDRVKFPLHQWVILNGCMLHGIVNVTGPRLNLNVSLRPESFTFDIRTKKADL